MSAPRHAIFISYRRRDSIYAVDRLDERLKHAFGADAVFRDVRSIRKGRDFPADIRNALEVARLGLVGPSRNGGGRPPRLPGCAGRDACATNPDAGQGP